MRKSSFVFSVMILTLALIAPGVRADTDCAKVQGDEQTTRSFPLGPVVGHAWLVIGNTLFHPEVTVITTGGKLGDDGSVVGTVRETFNFGGGNTFTIAEQHFTLSSTETPGVFRLNSEGKISAGTGNFEDAYGKLVWHGDISFSPGGVASTNLTVKGRVCKLGE